MEKIKLSIPNLAKVLGKDAEFIRLALQLGVLPFGTAIKVDGNTNYSYILYPQKVKEYVGDYFEGFFLDDEIKVTDNDKSESKVKTPTTIDERYKACMGDNVGAKVFIPSVNAKRF